MPCVMLETYSLFIKNRVKQKAKCRNDSKIVFTGVGPWQLMSAAAVFFLGYLAVKCKEAGFTLCETGNSMLEYINGYSGFIHLISARILTILVYLIKVATQTKVSLTK